MSEEENEARVEVPSHLPIVDYLVLGDDPHLVAIDVERQVRPVLLDRTTGKDAYLPQLHRLLDFWPGELLVPYLLARPLPQRRHHSLLLRAPNCTRSAPRR